MARSAWEGSATPLGCPWPTTIAEALCIKARRTTTRGMDGGAVDGAVEQLLVGDGLVPVVEEDGDEDLVAAPAKAGLEVAPGVVRRSERAVAAQPCLHPAGVNFEDRMDPRPVLGRQEEQAQRVVGIVEHPAQAAGGGERGGVEVDPDEAEQLMVVEGGGTRAPDAGEQRLGRCR